MTPLIEPHGGVLKERYVSAEEANRLKAQAQDYPSWDLTPRQLCDLELLLNGSFSPLEGFLNQADYDQTIREMRLSDGAFWPMPITLDVSEAFAQRLNRGDWIALRDAEGVLIAVLEVGDLWQPDRQLEARQVFGGDDERHPGVFHLLQRTGSVYIGGRVRGIEPPTHYDFPHLRASPHALRARFAKLGWQRVIAFQSSQPLHRAQQALILHALRQTGAYLLLHPAVGLSGTGDLEHYARVRCHEHILHTYPQQTATLSLLNLAPRLAGLRETLWYALVHQNHGCTHFMVSHEPAKPGPAPFEQRFPESYATEALTARYQSEFHIQILPVPDMVYVQERAHYIPAAEVRSGETVLSLSETELQRRLQDELEIPEWFAYPDVIAELRRIHPPRHRQGFTVFFTGLSGSGKSTIANALRDKLLERGSRPVTLLDGDLVRKHLSSELGFSREHRNLNILRIGFVASEITKNGGIAICAPIAPYAATRREVREMIEPLGGFIEVHVATSLETCEERDRKGLYAKARAGLLKEFTGISDPYEVPTNPELTLDTRDCPPAEAAQRILLKLETLGYLRGGIC